MEFLFASLSDKLDSLVTPDLTVEQGETVDAIGAIIGHLKSVAGEMKMQSEKAVADLDAVRKDQVEVLNVLINLTSELNTTSVHLDATLHTAAQLESQKLRDVRRLEMEKRELRDRLDEETKDVKLLDTAETQPRDTRGLRIESESMEASHTYEEDAISGNPFNPFLPSPSTLQRPATLHDNEIEIRRFSTQLSEKESRISGLERHVSQLEYTAKSAVEGLREAEKRVRSLQERLVELEVENAGLGEEVESYYMLLERKTVEGAFLKETGLMRRLGESVGVSDGRGFGGEGAEGGEDVVDTLNEKKLKAEIKALTLYIEKIISKLLSNPALESALLTKQTNPYVHDDNENEPKSPTAQQNRLKNRVSLLARLPVAAVEIVRSVSFGGVVAGLGRRASTPPAGKERPVSGPVVGSPLGVVA
ncbi:hypothetical protein HDU98_003736 [Podochytrium sp. JEL0797]|nr:hypothetical protein HDU98_003736 [Podochytrium sp. JEL0797]